MSYETCLKKISPSLLPPFSLRYGGDDISNINEAWTWQDESGTEEANGAILHKRIYLSGDGLLEVTCEMKEFVGSDVVEWILYLENPGDTDSRIISNLLALDINIPTGEHRVPTVLYSRACATNDHYALYKHPVLPEKKFHIGNGGGKTVGYIPFFNLCDQGRGYIGALGWLGHWELDVERTAPDQVRLMGQMPNMHLYLKPGERISTPRVLLMQWEGDWIDAQNRLRRHNLTHNAPHYDGKPVEVPISYSRWGGLKTEHALELMDQFEKEGVQYDTFWMDAGWYGEDREEAEYQVFGEEDWFLYAGDWRENRICHPEGLRPIADAAHKHHMKYLLWFEPERVVFESPIGREHPEWIVGDVTVPFMGHRDQPLVRMGTFNFGNEEARKWMTDEMDKMITNIGIDIFRQDFNCGPMWHCMETEDRYGMEQIRTVEGLMEFWDELRRRHPDLMFDLCQRCDLDSMCRSVDLCRSDYEIHRGADPMCIQNATMSQAFWRPHFGNLICIRPGGDDYHVRSSLAPGLALTINGTSEQILESEQNEASIEWIGKVIKEAYRARPYYYGDYYPLTVPDLNRSVAYEESRAYAESVFSTDQSDWCAYQMNRADLGEGMVMVLKRPESLYQTARFPLRGLDADATYELESVDTQTTLRMTGHELMQEGLAVEIKEKPGSRLYFYRQIDNT